MATKKKLKNLEGAILGAIRAGQPCTAYSVHRSFSKSPSLYFSGSAGAVYPAFRRLEERGLIKATKVGTKMRPAKGYVLTKAGIERFQAWYFDPELIADGGFDPLRLRFSMIESQSKESRAKVLEDLIAAVKAKIKYVKQMRSHLPKTSVPYFSGQLELVALQAKLKQLQTWKKEGPALEKIDIGFSALYDKK